MTENPVPVPFRGFPKIPRFSRDIIITEKIDGTNGIVAIEQDGQFLVGSRTRWITPATDNAGFAKWAYANKQALIDLLGPGTHFGEWWGQGIQRGYGLKEKRFSLFNVSRWTPEHTAGLCYVVPILYQGPFVSAAISDVLFKLEAEGSVAALGYDKPEGIVIYHIAGGYLFKKTLVGDEYHKGELKEGV